MTKHEELYSLFKEGEEVCRRISAVQAKLYENPFYAFFHKKGDNLPLLTKRKDKLVSDFNNMFDEVLRDNHGITDENIVGKSHIDAFSVLVDRRLHEVKPRCVGKRFVFFVDDVALGEEEKITDLLKSVNAV